MIAVKVVFILILQIHKSTRSIQEWELILPLFKFL